jgi:Fe-S cluster biosynthesis and repair protein YggX
MKNFIQHKELSMAKMIFCSKLNKESEAMPSAPFPGEFGARIQQNISTEAWRMWLNHQTMLINEYRLNLIDKTARDFLKTEMEKFLFGEGSTKPEGYTPV